MARTAADAVLYRTDAIESEEFLDHARPGARARRPRHGHRGQQPAVQRRLTTRSPRDRRSESRHEQPRRAGRRRRAVRAWLRGDDADVAALDDCLRRHQVPRLPADLGLTRSSSRPRWRTHRRPGRNGTRSSSTRARRRSTSASGSTTMSQPSAERTRPSLDELRAIVHPPKLVTDVSREHWIGRLYMRRVSLRLTRWLAPTRATPDGLTWLMVLSGLAAALVLTVPAAWSDFVAVLLIQVQILCDCSDGELARWRGWSSPRGIYLDRFGHYTTDAAVVCAVGVHADGGLGSIAGWTTVGMAGAVLVLVSRAETDLVHVARAYVGLPRFEPAAIAPQVSGSVAWPARLCASHQPAVARVGPVAGSRCRRDRGHRRGLDRRAPGARCRSCGGWCSRLRSAPGDDPTSARLR